MHTTQAAIVFSLVLTVICAVLSLSPSMYFRTQELAEVSVICQEENNTKDAIFKVLYKGTAEVKWEIEVSCPEKAYRLGKGVRDSLNILFG